MSTSPTDATETALEADPAVAGELDRRGRNAEAALSALRQVASMLGRVQGRKALIYVGQGIDIDVDRSARSADLLAAMREFTTTAARTNVQVYTIDPRGLAGSDEAIETPQTGDLPTDPNLFQRMLSDSVRASADSMRAWANDTGGVSIVATNDLDAGLAKIAQDSSRYYALGYYSDHANDGRFHRIEIRVKRPGLTVRSRRGFLASRPAGDERNVNSTRATAGRASPLEEALGLPLVSDGVHLRVNVASFLGIGGKNEVIVGIAAAGSDINVATQDDGRLRAALDFHVLALDPRGRLAAGRRQTDSVTFEASRLDAFRSEGLRGVERLELAPGRYRLRVGAAAPGSPRVGVVQADIEVPDLMAAPLTASGLLLSSARTKPSRSAASAERFSPWLPNGPTIERRFTQDDTVTALAEIYAVAPSPPIRVEARLLDEQGSAVRQEDATLADDGQDRRRTHVVRLPLGNLQPGRYTLRMDIRSVGESQSVRREVMFDVSSGRSEPQGAGAPKQAAQSGRLASTQPDPLLDAVLLRLAAYLNEYGQQFANVVAEEEYEQRLEMSPNNWMGEVRVRHLRSDLLLLRVAGPDTWMPFRDVFEVDGKSVRDRDERLQRLFLEHPESALIDARRIADEGARFNIGPVYRNFNLPTLTLMFFTPEHMPGFSFQRRAEETVEGTRTWRIDYQETARPTVMGVLPENGQESKGDMPANGSLWVDPLTGRVLRTRVLADVGGYRFDGTVNYRQSATLGILVPSEMRENYSRRGAPDIVGRAVYRNFRHFQVTTEQKIGPPKREK